MRSLFLPILLVISMNLHAESISELMARGDKLDAQLKSEQALKVYLDAEKLAPKDTTLLIKIAKQYGESMTDLKSADAQRKAGDKALAYSQRALKESPKMADANLAVAICYGRLLDLVSVRTRVEYSRLVHDYAAKATELDPKSDYAWHMLGRWNLAVATMSGLTKGIVSIVYGGLPDASLVKAKECFEKAEKLNSQRLAHVVELGRTLAVMGKKQEAKKTIERGLAMPDQERDDPDTKVRGRESLKAL